MKYYLSILIAILVNTLLQSISFAIDSDQVKASFKIQQSQHQCADLLKDCLTMKDEDKDSCIQEATENIFCKGTKLSALANKRWSYSALQTDNRLTDKSCLNNFDNLFSAKLMQDVIIEDSLKELSENLNTCKKISTIEINRQ